LQDVFDGDEVRDFLDRVAQTVAEPQYSVEPKVDGLSVALEYRDGVFVRGATRGDGRIGEDVTENLRTIRSIPMTLPEKLPRLIVRGEVYMSRAVFEELNAQREVDGQPLMANPRNAAAGSLRQLDPKVAASRKLDIAIFNLQLAEGKTFTTHTETMEYLASQKFKVISGRCLSSAEEIIDEINRLDETRTELSYDMDGAVIKLNDLAQRERLGSTAKCPKWAIAYKYPPEQKSSQLVDIVVQVGRTGVLTPKAVLKPVRLAGTTVTNATLHNQDYITEKDIRIGDTVIVQKAGEIIPEIVEVVKDKRPADTVPYFLPETCPVCGAPVSRDIDGAAVRCTGVECPAQLLRNLTHFASRGAMDIDGLGPAVIGQLVDHGLVSTAADLYDLKAEEIAKLDRMGDKSAENAINAIAKSKENDLWRLVFALGIRQVGEKAAKVLAAHFGTMDALAAATEEELTAINDVEYSDPVEAIRKVEEIGSKYGIGRDMHIGDTIIGIKGRVGFEAAAPMLIIAAHKMLEKHTLTKWQLYWKEQVATWYGMFLHEAQYLEPVMRDIEAMLESSQRNVTGTVILTLRPLGYTLVGVESSFDLMKTDFGEYGEVNKAWTADDVKGFTKILGNQIKIFYNVQKRNK
ncbi:MAG: NAD-dependent DNA ligase LigA, partial [Alistipes sp.]|nr:NAD-dependent DNA ligase LigA [Alistipes sp.]